jgi:PEP-CTERM motif
MICCLRVRFSSLALLTMLSTLAVGSRASADQTLSLTLNGNYNTTPITFSYAGSSNPVTVSGGGVVGGSLGGVAVPYLYCLQWSLDVVVPNTYAKSLVNSIGDIHGGLLQQQPSGALEADDTQAKNIAYLVDKVATGATDAISQAALQAAIWSQVTPGFKLVYDWQSLSWSDYQTLKGDFNADLGLLPGSIADGSANDYRGSMLFISPSTDGDVHNHNQGLIGYIPGTGGINHFIATPEPATFAMALSGLVPIAVAALRRRRGAVTTA